MHGPLNVKFVNVKQAKETYQYKNTKEKLHKTNTAIWYNKIRREIQFRPEPASRQHNLYDKYLLLCIQY